MGSVHHSAVVVVWRGQPGWMFNPALHREQRGRHGLKDAREPDKA